MFHSRIGATKRRLGGVAALGLAVALIATGCAADGGRRRRRRRTRNLAITFIPKNLGNAYFDTSDAGGKEAIDEFGGTYAEVASRRGLARWPGAATSTRETQKGVGGLVISANDPTALCGAIGEARDAGIKVVTFDADTSTDCRDVFINQAEAEGIAKVQVDLIAEQIGDAGQVAILSATANATNQNAWIEIMEQLLAERAPEHRTRRGRLRRRRRSDLVRQDGGRCCRPTPT